MRKELVSVADYIDGAKQYLTQAIGFMLWLAVRLHFVQPTIEEMALVGMGLAGISGLIRSVTWKPGAMSGAVSMTQPDGGTLVVKPPPEQP